MLSRTFTWEGKCYERDHKDRLNVTLGVTNEKLEPLLNEILKCGKIVSMGDLWDDYCNSEDISYFVSFVIEESDKDIVFECLRKLNFHEI